MGSVIKKASTKMPICETISRTKQERSSLKLRSFVLNSSGTTALEFALIAAPLLLFTFGIIEMGRLVFMQQSLNRATDSAARLLYISPEKTVTDLKNSVVSNSFLIDPAAITISVNTLLESSDPDKIIYREIKLNYDFNSLFPSWFTDSISLEFERTVVVAR